MLTDAAKDFIEWSRPGVRALMRGFITYALIHHVGVRDGLALTFAFFFVCSAIESRGDGVES